jgi:hypothetical protein
MKRKMDVRQGTLAPMALKILDVLGPSHGYGLAWRIEPEKRDWQQTAAIVARFFEVKAQGFV